MHSYDNISRRLKSVSTKFSPDGLGGGGCLREYVGAVVGTKNWDSDSEFLIPTPWSDESKNEKRQKEKRNKVMKDNVLQEHVCEEEVPLNNNLGKLSGYLVEMPSEVVKQGMDDHVHDDIDGVKGEQVPNHAAKKGNLEFLVRKEVPNHGGDELVEKG
ncbi:hypothetical protein Tco_1532222 [Tanacetum coccineum]